MRILTYNIHGGRGRDGVCDYARIGRFLKAQAIDVALLQEVDTRVSRVGNQPVLPDLLTDHFREHAAAPTIHEEGGGWFGNVILSRHPVERTNVIDISDPNAEPRCILEVVLRTSAGRIRVVNTHHGLRALERQHQLRRLCQLLSDDPEIPLVIGGDLNEWHPYSSGIRELNGALHSLRTGPTFPVALPLFRLDRFWCRPSTLAKQVQVVKTPETRIQSDHLPVLMQTTFNGESGR